MERKREIIENLREKEKFGGWKRNYLINQANNMNLRFFVGPLLLNQMNYNIYQKAEYISLTVIYSQQHFFLLRILYSLKCIIFVRQLFKEEKKRDTMKGVKGTTRRPML
jgi:hypothetical protein